MFYDDIFYKNFSEKIDWLDYSSYTMQYPPPFLSENDFDNDFYIHSFDSERENCGLYIHIPFCETKCTFCRYYSIIDTNDETFEKYCSFLIKELALYVPLIKWKINSLYFGGWTPSILTSEQLDMILWFIFDNFILSEDFQFIFEVNPSSVTLEKLKVLKKYNCDRLTMWVQTLDTKVLKIINRNQTLKNVTDTIILSRQVGIEFINVDIMLWIKWQTLHSFLSDITAIVALGPDMIHLHTYEPTIRVIDNKSFHHSNSTKALMSKIWNQYLLQKGYFMLDGDAFWKDQNAKNKQLFNAQYGWKYIGIWVSAVWYNWTYRYINHEKLSEYYSLLNNNLFPIKFGSKVSTHAKMVQYIIYNMRYWKLDLLDFTEKFNSDFFDHFMKHFEILFSKWVVVKKANELIFRLNTADDYVIYSKYFYEDHILDFYKKNYEK